MQRSTFLSMTMNLALLCLVFLMVNANRVASVDVSYKLCGSKNHMNISSIESNAWPPIKGQNLNLNVTGSLDEDVSDGKYTISIKIDGFPIPALKGDISDFKALPWDQGAFDFTYTQEIPSSAPSGSYSLTIQANDQNDSSILCVDLAFTLSSDERSKSSVKIGSLFNVAAKTANTVRSRVRDTMKKIPKLSPIKPSIRR